MRRHVTANLSLDVVVPSDLVLSIASSRTGQGVDEDLSLLLDGHPVQPEIIIDSHDTRLHRVKVRQGRLDVSYEATVEGREEPLPTSPGDVIRYLRPSRYAESDELAPTAFAEFKGLSGLDLLHGVSSWVGTQLSYVPGSSQPTDGASRTLLSRQGVCRDFAHLCVALLRARGVPARLVSVYAPGLEPMDFHAVCEAYVDGRWLVVDATTLAPRESMLRIATGRDAADTAFLTTISGRTDLVTMDVAATADDLPSDDLSVPVSLG